MASEYEGDLHDRLNEIMDLEDQGEIQVTKVIPEGSVYFKIQDQYHDGNGVYFNPHSDNRFSLSDKSKWPMYMADSPHTAGSEFFQDEKFIDRADFETNCMAEITTEQPLKVFDLIRLSPHLRWPVGDLMAPKATYPLTQQLAKEMSQYADGVEYLSRHSGKPCLAIWSDMEDGDGLLSTSSVTALSEYEHQGKSARQILRTECNVRITG
ncbi:RES domain-containing protein [Pantoea ananatis]|uniref:RES domain-containing protein n=1 Tax=Pantoea ananas TaxID=553 RepID=UPI0024B80BC5|nr:RES domain-containing protein [Pantoea ananatis]MDJ0044591.1 RES domain-containing protein [Pantoea ananatis]